ncbi:MAG: hypothetical protein ACE5OR_03960 [bacterium]
MLKVRTFKLGIDHPTTLTNIWDDKHPGIDQLSPIVLEREPHIAKSPLLYREIWSVCCGSVKETEVCPFQDASVFFIQLAEFKIPLG